MVWENGKNFQNFQNENSRLSTRFDLSENPN